MILRENEKTNLPKRETTLRREIFEISIGVLLGDASIQTNTSKREEKHKLKFLQGKKHELYLYHLYDCYTDFVLSKAFVNSERGCVSFQTVFDARFNGLAQIFLKTNSPCKRRGKSLDLFYFSKNAISPRSLAYWFMDDGGKLFYNKDWERRGLVFNTQGFNLIEVKTLSKNISESYNVDCWVKENKGKPVIAISGFSSKKLISTFLEFIHPTMLFKLPKKLLRELYAEKLYA